jgi:CHAP domain
VSIETTLARIHALQTAFVPPQPPAAPPAVDFATQLQSAQSGGAAAPVAPAGSGGVQAMLNAARAELGVTEQPPGSNESPRIREYRSASGSPPPGPWCAYFVSWAARQAGMPIGPIGSGFGSVDAVWSWAEQAGRTSQQPRPGDLIVWDEHIGIVEAVLPDGRIQTIEGNTSNMVARRTHSPDGVVGYVRMS